MRLCGVLIPDVEKITDCMSTKFREVSPQCRIAMIREHYKARARLRGPRVSSEN